VEGFKEQIAVIKDNERVWQSIEKIWQTMKERFERQEKENERIWQAIEKTNEQTRKQVRVLTDNFGYLLEDRVIITSFL
jgi:ribonuclease HI